MEPEPAATLAITSSHSLHQNLAEPPRVLPLTLPDLPLPEDAETAAYTQRFQFTPEADFDTLIAHHYLDFYQTMLWLAAWRPNNNTGRRLMAHRPGMRFWR